MNSFFVCYEADINQEPDQQPICSTVDQQPGPSRVNQQPGPSKVDQHPGPSNSHAPASKRKRLHDDEEDEIFHIVKEKDKIYNINCRNSKTFKGKNFLFFSTFLKN